MNKKIKIFLTGGGGFIGRNILEQLGEKYEFIFPSSEELDLTDADKVDSFFKAYSPDIVLHAANLGGKRNDLGPDKVVFLNLQMFFNIVRNKEYFGRMIMFGSGAEYDKRFDIINASEEDFDRRAPVDQYGFYKYICAKYAARTDFITHLRFFGVYGKYEDYRIRFISDSICRALSDLPLTINQNVLFDYLYVDDAVKILEKIIDNKPKDTFYNIGSGKREDLLSIAKIVLEETGKDLPIKIAKAELNKEYTCNADKLKNEFKDIKFTDTREAVRLMVGYYKSILSNIDINKF